PPGDPDRPRRALERRGPLLTLCAVKGSPPNDTHDDVPVDGLPPSTAWSSRTNVSPRVYGAPPVRAGNGVAAAAGRGPPRVPRPCLGSAGQALGRALRRRPGPGGRWYLARR